MVFAVGDAGYLVRFLQHSVGRLVGRLIPALAQHPFSYEVVERDEGDESA